MARTESQFQSGFREYIDPCQQGFCGFEGFGPQGFSELCFKPSKINLRTIGSGVGSGGLVSSYMSRPPKPNPEDLKALSE